MAAAPTCDSRITRTSSHRVRRPHPDHTFVRAWAHHGMVNLAEGKMAKSLGNILDVEEAVERHGRNALRMWLLQSHYSQPIDYSEEILEEKRRSYERLMRLYRTISTPTTASELSARLASELRDKFDAAMQDDFNTPEAIAAVFDVAGRAGRETSERPEAALEFASFKDALEEVLGTLGFDLSGELEAKVDGVSVRYTEEPDDGILEKVSHRELARREKDWKTADLLRDELQTGGWTVEDTSEGPILRRR